MFKFLGSINFSVLPEEEDAGQIERILGEYASVDAKIRGLQALGQETGADWQALEEKIMDPSLDRVQTTEYGDSVNPLYEEGKLYNVANGGKVEVDYLISNAGKRSMNVTVFTKYGKFNLEEILGSHGCTARWANPTYLRFGALEEAVIKLLPVFWKYCR